MRLKAPFPPSSYVEHNPSMRRLFDLDVAVAHGGHGTAMTKKRMHEIAGAYLGDQASDRA